MDKKVFTILQNTKLFCDITVDECENLLQHASIEHFNPGDIIIQEHSKGDKVYIILEGSVHVFTYNQNGQKTVLALLEKGAYFGEQALLYPKPIVRNASVCSLELVKVLAVTRADFRQQLKSRPKKMLLSLLHEGDRQLITKQLRQIQDNGEFPHEISHLFDQTRHLNRREVLFRQGDDPDNAYFLLRGSVVIRFYDENNIIQFSTQIMPSQFFGERALIEGSPRSGTAIALSTAEVAVIPGAKLLEAYNTNLALQSIFNNMTKVYKIPGIGLMTQHEDIFLGQPCIVTKTRKPNGESITTTLVNQSSIFSSHYDGIQANQEIEFIVNGTLLRKLSLLNKSLIGITSVGESDDLSTYYRWILDKTVISDAKLQNFKETGNLSLEPPSQADELLCQCMRIKQSTIEQLIAAGNISMEEIRLQTGASTVCGGCTPRIKELLGINVWHFVILLAVREHTPNIRSFELQPKESTILSYQPGQHIVIQALIDNHWVSRSYTLTSSDENKMVYEITVKRETNGLFSNWIFSNDTQETQVLRISEPQGSFIFDPTKETPAICFVGGVGVTPAVAFARKLIASNNQRRLHIDYSIHDAAQMCFYEEFESWPQLFPYISIQLHETKLQGRINTQHIEQIIQRHENADIFICGPPAYTNMLLTSLQELNIEPERIHHEIFVNAADPINHQEGAS